VNEGQRLDAVRAGFTSTYGVDLSDLSVVDGALRGNVLTRKQLSTLQREFGTEATSGVTVLELARSDDARVAGRVRAKSTPQRLRPAPGDTGLCTEWLERDGAARVLGSSAGWLCVQLVDGTLGWLERDEADEVAPDGATAGAAGPFVQALGEGQLIDADRPTLERLRRDLLSKADSRLEYRLGGRDPDSAVDCSSLIQLAIHEQTGVWLPRHTSDQRRRGDRVARRDLASDDLLFVRALEKRWMHVGYVVADDEVVHACRLDRRVRRESIESFLSRYRFVGARRLFRLV